MYDLPDLNGNILWEYAVPVPLISIISTVCVTAYVSIVTLKEKPSTLMLPKTPKSGKRILLENINFIWSRMKFTHKSTARNIFRYKRHFVMTVTGIAGCTALMLTGFGLLDSIGKVANTQFEDIFKYDLTIQLNDEEDDSLLYDFLKGNIYAKTMTNTIYIDHDNDEIAATVVVPENHESLNDVIEFNDLKTGQSLSFGDSSVIMTEKLAEKLGLKVGDSFIIKNEDKMEAEFTLTGITENYVGIYLYINNADYEKAFNEQIEYNTIMVDSNIEDGFSMDETVEMLLGMESVMSAEPLSQLKKSFDNLLANINFIVIVLVVSSGALAVIVLYNLTNININRNTSNRKYGRS
jgi:putative ABC transport system permease protein